MTLEVASTVASALPSFGKLFDYSVYLVFGLLFGLLPLVLPCTKDSDLRAPSSRVHLLATCAGLVVCLLLLGPSLAQVSVPAALVSAGIATALSGRPNLLAACQAFWPTLVTFHVVLLLLDHPLHPGTGTDTVSLTIAFVLSFGFVWFCLSGRLTRLQRMLTPLAHVVLTATIVIFARTMVPLSSAPTSAQVHWGAIIGPVELMRDGGRVLYDVPLQYGLLNTLIVYGISALVGDAWLGFQWFFQGTTALQGLLLYLVLGRLLRRLPMCWPAAAALTVGSLFMMQGLDCCLGTYVSPAIGMYRYLPVWLLVSYVVYRWTDLNDRRFYSGGCSIWLIGCAWSAEILLLTTVSWFGCVALRVATSGCTGIASWRFVRAIAPILLAHVLAFMVALTLGIGLYAARYGGLPDLPRYFDFLFNVTDTGWFAVRAADYPASVVPVLAGILTTVGLVRLSRRRVPGCVMGPAYVAALGFWAASSYFASRSLPIIVSYLPPYILMSLLAVMPWPAEVRSVRGTMTVAFCAAFLALPFGFASDERLSVFETALQPQPRLASVIPWYASPVSDIVSTVLETSGESTIPLVHLGESVPDEVWPPGARSRFPRQRFWLPLVPESLLIPLPHTLRALYIARWASRAPQAGWVIIETSTHIPGDTPRGSLDFIDVQELQEYLSVSHVVTVDESRGAYRVMRFEPRPGGP